ncbi:MAG: cytochrome c1 [Gammaproteobacteria bacterium]|nr:MAG: cytochrome c1 [Gammaproteobacteria bacterium]
MKKLILIAILLGLAPVVLASGHGGYPLDKADVDLENKDSLQRGAKMFVNYCMGCHSMRYMRYNRVAKDLGIPEDIAKQDLIFVTDENGDKVKIGTLMKNAMREKYAKEAFGTKIPDLTLEARVRGADWLYTYLRTFYLDDSRPTGVNNAVFHNVGMPHVLWKLQGLQKAKIEEYEDHEGNKHHRIVGFEMVQPGTMTGPEYDKAVRDLVNFLVYMGEPVKLERMKLGVYVLLFLAVFFVLAYFLKKEYWKDVH